MRGVDLAQSREERLGRFGVVAETPVHHRELEQHPLLVFELLPRSQCRLVHGSELVPGLEIGVVPNQRPERFQVGWGELEHLAVRVRRGLGVAEGSPEHPRCLQPAGRLLFARSRGSRGPNEHRNDIFPTFAGAKAERVLSRRAHVRGIRSERLVENRIGFLDRVVAAVLPHQRSCAGQKRGLEPRVRRIARLLDETSRELAPLLFDLMELVDGLRDLRVLRLDAAELLVRIERALVVHQLFTSDAPELFDENLLELRIIRDELGFDFHEPGSGQELAASLVSAARSFEQSKRILVVVGGVRALQPLTQPVDQLGVVRVFRK